MNQYLYVMAVPSGYIKVGIAANYKSRLSQVQVGNPEPVSVAICVDTELDGVSAVEIERTVHWLLRGVKVRGEWFAVSVETAAYAIKIAWAKLKYPEIYARWLRKQ